MRDLTISAIISRLAVTWPPAAGAGEEISLAAATGRGINGDENHPPQLEENEAHKRRLGAELGPEEHAATDELRKTQEDISLEPKLPEELLEPPELLEIQPDVAESETGLGTLEDEESEPDWQAEQRGTLATFMKLRRSFTGDLYPVLPSRTRSGGQEGRNQKVGGGEGAGEGNDHMLCYNAPSEQMLPAFLGPVDVNLGQISLESRRAGRAIALQAASTMPTGLASYLPDKPSTLHEDKMSPEWSQRRGALKREISGQIARGVWKVVDRPKEKNILGIKTVS